MGDAVTFFFDSYALIEIYEKGIAYEKYSRKNAITSYFQVYETYYILEKNGYSEQEIRDFYDFLQNLCIDLKFEWIPKAVEFRKRYKERDLSYADCIGYIIANELKIKFLTGDKEFKDLPNVEFVKKK